MIYKSVYSSPVGYIEICADSQAVFSIKFDSSPSKEYTENDISRLAAKELGEYFAGSLQGFTFPIKTEGTAFQEEVYSAVKRIPYGETRTYKQIAAEIGDDKAARAVGNALNKNPVLIAIPCHRVIGLIKSSLFGYSAGEMIKEALLNFEKNQLSIKKSP